MNTASALQLRIARYFFKIASRMRLRSSFEMINYSFKYLGSLITTAGVEEIISRVAKSRATFLDHEFRLPLSGRVYNTTTRSVPLYGIATWILRVEDVWRLCELDLKFNDDIILLKDSTSVLAWVDVSRLPG